MENNEVIDALRKALEVSPDDQLLRKHLADLLLAQNRFEEAEKEFRELTPPLADEVLTKLALARAFLGQQKWMVALVVLEQIMKGPDPVPESFLLAVLPYLETNQIRQAVRAYREAVKKNSALADPELERKIGFDITQADASEEEESSSKESVAIPLEDWPQPTNSEIERSGISFIDVGGMDKLKDEIRMKIIFPLTKPDIYKAYGKSAGGGILMYGPPGCGKTYLARATAGEVDAYFLSIGLHDVLNMYLGQSEQNLHELFELARRHKPCVLFIDEADALGANRTDLRQSAGRLVINQLLTELDGHDRSNDEILVLAATNAPWHLDPALRRPGRFDRVIFVPPPDLTAREAILQVMLRDKPVEKVDAMQIAKKTDGFSGADLMAVVDTAVEDKLREAMKNDTLIPLNSKDLLRAISAIKPTTMDWFASARNYALYSNQSGLYDEVLEYLKMDKGSHLLGGFPLGGRK